MADEISTSIQMIRKHNYKPTRKKDKELYWHLIPEYIHSIAPLPCWIRSKCLEFNDIFGYKKTI